MILMMMMMIMKKNEREKKTIRRTKTTPANKTQTDADVVFQLQWNHYYYVCFYFLYE